MESTQEQSREKVLPHGLPQRFTPGQDAVQNLAREEDPKKGHTEYDPPVTVHPYQKDGREKIAQPPSVPLCVPQIKIQK